MTAADMFRGAIYVIAAVFGGGVISVLFQYRAQNEETKAKAAKLNAETRAIEVDDQSDIITNLRSEVRRLDERLTNQDGRLAEQDQKIASQSLKIAEQGEQIAKLQRRNHDLGATMRAAVAELLDWIKKALAVMTPDQQTSVGHPPDYNHLITPPERS